MIKKNILMMIVFAAYVVYAGTAGNPVEKEGVKPAVKNQVAKRSSHLVITAAAQREFKNQKNKKWLISYNGTCSDMPALGFYQDEGRSDSDGLVVQQAGVVIFIEQKTVSLFEEWGDITVDCTDYNGDKPGGKQFIAAFKKNAVNE